MEGNSIDSPRRTGVKRTIDESQHFEEQLTADSHQVLEDEESEECMPENGENNEEGEETEETYNNVDHQYLAQSEDYSKFKSIKNENGNLIICSPHESLESYKSTWTRYMTQMLIEEYRKMLDDFKNPHKKQKDLWFDLANNMCRRGCDVTWDMCDRKWRNLKHTFKTIYFSRHRSENSKRRWEFYTDLEEFFVPQGNDEMLRKSRTVSPVFEEEEESDASSVRESILLKTSKIPRISKTTTSPVTYAQILDMSNAPESAMYPQIILCDRNDVPAKTSDYSKPGSSSTINNSDVHPSESPPPWFLDFLKEYRRDEQNRLALFKEMHSELMQVEKRKCVVLEGILKKLM